MEEKGKQTDYMSKNELENRVRQLTIHNKALMDRINSLEADTFRKDITLMMDILKSGLYSGSDPLSVLLLDTIRNAFHVRIGSIGETKDDNVDIEDGFTGNDIV